MPGSVRLSTTLPPPPLLLDTHSLITFPIRIPPLSNFNKMSATQSQVESKASPTQSVRFASSSNLNDLESASPTPTYNSHSNAPTPTYNSNAAGPTTRTQISALRKYTLLIVFCLAQFVDVFNISALFSAIPVMSEELDIDAGQSAWIISALQLTFAAFLLAVSSIFELCEKSEVV